VRKKRTSVDQTRKLVEVVKGSTAQLLFILTFPGGFKSVDRG